MDWINIEDEEPRQNQRIWVPSDQGDVLALYAGNRRICQAEGWVGNDYRDYLVTHWRNAE